ncbi:MAG: class IV adenylate cyclase [Planctomycetota bacterium]|nr:class IV adenylate cyclase [Planctomycetota bacterium]
MYEVELKFPLVNVAAVEKALGRLSATVRPPIDQADLYFAHPSRDFALTDEALRLRREGDAVAITWKGPRLGQEAKTRREIELPLAGIVAAAGAEATLAAWGELLEALGFRRVWEVLKRRRRSEVSWQGSTIEVAIDTVTGLGDFLELEILASAAEIPLALASLQSLAAEIGLGQPERRSYLEMLLAARPPD